MVVHGRQAEEVLVGQVLVDAEHHGCGSLGRGGASSNGGRGSGAGRRNGGPSEAVSPPNPIQGVDVVVVIVLIVMVVVVMVVVIVIMAMIVIAVPPTATKCIG